MNYFCLLFIDNNPLSHWHNAATAASPGDLPGIYNKSAYSARIHCVSSYQ
jgi:hypothetical protein